jgi:formiminotetrahydrofolate cyclodeaminase
MNVYINLSAIKDENFVAETKEECEGMLAEARQIRAALWNCLRTKIQGLPNE